MTADRRLIDHEDVLAEDLGDRAFRQEWERTAPGRRLAIELSHYRAEHDLSQLELAERLGVHQSDIAAMESGEVADPNADRVIEILDAIPLAWERTQEGLAQAARGEGAPLEECS